MKRAPACAKIVVLMFAGIRSCVFSTLLIALPLAAQRHPVKVYTAADGLGHNRVKRIVPDSKGFLWFCTSDGLTRFDGLRFVNFGSNEGAPFVSVNDLLELPDGGYWIASNGDGVIRFNPSGELQPVSPVSLKSRFRRYAVGDEAASNRVNVLYRDRAGTVWLGSDAGLFRLVERKGVIEIRAVPLGLAAHGDRQVQVNAIVADDHGGFFAGTRFGVIHVLADGRRVHYPLEPGPGLSFVHTLLYRDSVLWIGHQGGLLLWCLPAPSEEQAFSGDFHEDLALSRTAGPSTQNRFPGLPQRANQVRSYQASGSVAAIWQMADGQIWFAGHNGFHSFSAGALSTVAADLPFRDISSIREDVTGNAWVASGTSGVAKLQRAGFEIYGDSDGIGSAPLQALLDRAGEVVVPSRPRQLAVWTETGFVPVQLQFSAVTFSGSASVIQDHNGEWWVGTTAGLFRYAKALRATDLQGRAPIAIYRRSDGLADEDAAILFEDSRGDIWITSFRPAGTGLSRWDSHAQRIVRYSEADGLPLFNAVNGIGEDHNGSLWFGFREGGLARYRDGHFQLFREAEGVPSGSVRAMLVDSRNRLWVSVQQRGVFRFDETKGPQLHAIFNATQWGPVSNIVTALYEDRQGRIYAGSARGIDRIDPRSGAVNHFGAADGIPGEDVTGFSTDPSGALWIGMQGHVCRLISGTVENSPSMQVLITGLRVSGIEYQVPAVGARALQLKDLPYQKNSIQIDYVRQAFTLGEAPVFQFKLEGADADWSQPTLLGTVNYADLGPGTYRFLVREAVSQGGTARPAAELSFRILSPYWRRGWFLVSAGLALLAGVAGFERYRAAKLKQVRVALEEVSKAHGALETEFAISDILARFIEKEAALPLVLETICQRVGWSRARLWEFDRESSSLCRTAEWPCRGPKDSGGVSSLAPGQDLPGQALQSQEMCWVTEPDGKAAFPLLTGHGALGVIELFSAGRREIDGGQVGTLSTICGLVGQWLERIRAEIALRESEARLRTLAETASDAIVTIDETGTIVFVNPSAADVFGYATSEMLGNNLTMLMPSPLRPTHQNGLARYLETGRRNISWRAMDLPGMHADGHEISLEISLGEFRRDEARFFTAVIRDVTERKRIEEALRRNQEERLAEIERVRRRIATDLHDDIGSSLTQISVWSEVLRQQMPGSSASLEKPLSLIAASSRELIDSMSDIVWAINPQRDHLSDLVHRMRRFAADALTARNIDFRLQFPADDEDIKLEGNLRREVFLIFKESLNNLVRHSGCSRAEIEFSRQSHGLLLRLSDDGQGFDLHDKSEGHGLASMRSRAAGIGATLDIISSTGNGTCLMLQIPLAVSAPT